MELSVIHLSLVIDFLHLLGRKEFTELVVILFADVEHLAALLEAVAHHLVHFGIGGHRRLLASFRLGFQMFLRRLLL